MRIFRDGELVLYCDACWRPQSDERTVSSLPYHVPIVEPPIGPGEAQPMAGYFAHVCFECRGNARRPRAVPVCSKRAPEPRHLIQDGIVYR